jgi:hypothetical protein
MSQCWQPNFTDDWNNRKYSKKNIGMGSGWEQKSHGLANTSIMQTCHGAAKLRFDSPKAALLT